MLEPYTMQELKKLKEAASGSNGGGPILRLISMIEDRDGRIQDGMKLGLKYDDGKLRWDLLPWEPIEEIVKVLTYGAKKYKENSWQHVDRFEDRYFAALMRHLVAWRNGEVYDKESGILHLSHAACNIMFLLSKQER
jgi:hypothetical protein